jgi:hypothetical protein
MYRNLELRKIALTITTAILVAGVLTITQMQPNAVMASANGDQIPSIITIPLEDLELDAGQFLLLADTTPEEVKEAHVAINVPCEDGETDIDVVAGVAPDVEPVDDLEYIEELSFPEDNCLFHADIPNNSDEVTDIAIINTGDEKVEFKSGNIATLSITEQED